jgi:large subunit ribosomal protein L19
MDIVGKKISPVEMAVRQKLDLKAGKTVKVWQKIQEKGKTRLQVFEGLVLAHKHGNESGATFTVRRVASGVGMEKIFPLYSPNIDKIEVLREAKTRRAKLYFIREKASKEIRRRMNKIAPKKKRKTNEVDELVEQVTAGIEVPTETAEVENKTEE